MYFYPKEDTLKILCWYLYWKCVRKGGSRRGVLGGHWMFLIRDMDDRVIPEVMNDVFLPPRKIPWKFRVYISIRRGSRRGVLGGHWGLLTGDMDERVIPDIMNDVYLALGRYPENFVLISQLEVCRKVRWRWVGGGWVVFTEIKDRFEPIKNLRHWILNLIVWYRISIYDRDMCHSLAGGTYKLIKLHKNILISRLLDFYLRQVNISLQQWPP